MHLTDHEWWTVWAAAAVLVLAAIVYGTGWAITGCPRWFLGCTCREAAEPEPWNPPHSVDEIVARHMAEIADDDEFEPELPDWTDAQLAALHDDLPGPATGQVATIDRQRQAQVRAGELHYMDTWLGCPGDGSEHTALRVRRDQERAMRDYERDQAADFEAQMAEMGVNRPWRGLVAA